MTIERPPCGGSRDALLAAPGLAIICVLASAILASCAPAPSDRAGAITVRVAPRTQPIVIASTVEYATSDRERLLEAYAAVLEVRDIPFEASGGVMLRSQRIRGELPEIVEITFSTADTVTHVNIRQLYYRATRDFLHFPHELPFLAEPELPDVLPRFRRIDPPAAVYPPDQASCDWPPAHQTDPLTGTVDAQPPAIVGGFEAFARRLRYPTTARRQRIEGTVYVTALIDEVGRVSCAEVTSGLPGGLTEEALRAVVGVRFTPALLNGEPVPLRLIVPVAFRLP